LISDLEVSRPQAGYGGKGSRHVRSFRLEKDLETLENSIIQRFGV
jgi:hypothetical protein